MSNHTTRIGDHHSSQGTSAFLSLDDAVQAADLPTLFEAPCAESWENEGLDSSHLILTRWDSWSPGGNLEPKVDFTARTWDRLYVLRWTETEGSRALPEPEIKFSLSLEVGREEYVTTGYLATLDTFSETRETVSVSGAERVVYACEAVYQIEAVS